MIDFSLNEQAFLDDMVARRTTSLPKPAWMPRHRATAIKAEARRLIGALPSTDSIPPAHTIYYNAAARVRKLGRGNPAYKIHAAGPDGRPICTMGDWPEWQGEELGPGPVTCGKCAGTRDP